MRIYSLLLAVSCVLLGSMSADAAQTPNFVVVVADDFGWRDSGYQGSPHAKTPALDEMAKVGVRFDYFYPAQQMCSPGRFAIMTGRNPMRTGLHHLGAMRKQELTIPQALKTKGYSTGHFGKWHLGDKDTSPAKMGFDRAIWKINFYDLGASLQVNDTKDSVPLEGDTSVATMKLAVDFIREQAAADKPFFVQVCFGSPHSPHRASEEFKAIYKDLPAGQQDFYGEVSGVDAAVGNLRAALRELKIADNTLVWFMSDNGGITPLSMDPTGKGKQSVGNRTAAVLEWPAGVKQPIQTNVVSCHADVYPTLLDIAGVKRPDNRPLDGISLLPLLEGKMEQRGAPLGFMLWNGGDYAKADLVAEAQAVWIDGSLKLIVPPAAKAKPAAAVAADGQPEKSAKNGKNRKNRKKEGIYSDAKLMLVDIYADPAHKKNLSESQPEDVQRMSAALQAWQKSVKASIDGADFPKK